MANLFIFLDVHRPWRKVNVNDSRAAVDFAVCMRELTDVHFPKAECIRGVLDNLSTHSAGALYHAFAPCEARRVLRRLEFHYVPKHGSWLNMFEIEIGVLRSQCLDRRIASHEHLISGLGTTAQSFRSPHEKERSAWPSSCRDCGPTATCGPNIVRKLSREQQSPAVTLCRARSCGPVDKRNFATLERLEFPLIVVNADHPMAKIHKTNSEIIFHTKDETMPSTGLKVYATRAQRLFRLSILALAAHSNSVNAQQTGMSKAEAALAGKIKCEDFKKNADGSWTSGPDTKIGSNPFPAHSFNTHEVSIGGADLATVLNLKCRTQ